MSDISAKAVKEAAPSREKIWEMFDAISKTYDQTNRLMTLGLDLYWRKKMASFLPARDNLCLLDCATGTGDQIISLLKHSKKIKEAFGVDLSEEMIALCEKKVKKISGNVKVHVKKASILKLPFPENAFDCTTLSFGIRNVVDVPLCLEELLRVLRPGGRALILETSLPKGKLLKALHLFYIRKILPLIGGWISQKKHAYRYLNKTAETFPYGDAFCKMLEEAGFINVSCHPLTFGSVSIYVADKT